MIPFNYYSKGLFGLLHKTRNSLTQTPRTLQTKQHRLFVISAAANQDVMLVESPAKAQKIQGYLGDEYKVIASYGHIRDLSPKAGSVATDEGFKMHWALNDGAETRVQEIAKAVQNCTRLFLATDPDREGEAISWHLLQELHARGALKDQTPTQRITFTEVTKPAILQALSTPREISEPLVKAYMARRALDYLYGYSLSPVLWQKLPGARSAGRVQSVALRLVSEREAEIEKFIPQKYWSVEADVKLPTSGGEAVHANLVFADGSAPPQPGYLDGQYAEVLANMLSLKEWFVGRVNVKESARNPAAPFTTSTLQQEANKKLGFGASRTMSLAQKLYEAGHITYMRTDGVTISPQAVTALRDTVSSSFGSEYLPDQPRVFASHSKNAQEAHEAIRPTDPTITPESLLDTFDEAAVKLYRLVLSRALASQMSSAKIQSVSVEFFSSDGSLKLKSGASRVAFAGHLAAMRQVAVDDDSDLEDGTDSVGQGRQGGATKLSEAARERLIAALAALQQGDVVTIAKSEAIDHETRPPGRYTEGTLVKALEEQGIGRPSTYAPIVRLLQARKYISKEGRALHAEPLGRVLTSFLHSYFDKYVDYGFTSGMEQQLDDVSGGDLVWLDVLENFWSPFNEKITTAKHLTGREIIDTLNENLASMLFHPQTPSHSPTDTEPQPSETDTLRDGTDIEAQIAKARECPNCHSPLSLKLSHKGGPFIGCSTYPKCNYSRPIKQDSIFDLDIEADGDDNTTIKDIQYDEDGDPIDTRKHDDDGETSSSSSLSSSTSTITGVGIHEDVATKYGMRGTVRFLGIDTDSGKDIFARQGPYGPYIQIGLDTDPELKRIPLPKSASIRSINMKYITGLTRLPRMLGKDPVTGDDVWVRNGKFGPYVASNNITRSIPKTMDPYTLSLEAAQTLLANRKAKIPAPRKVFTRLADKERAQEALMKASGRLVKVSDGGEQGGERLKKVGKTPKQRPRTAYSFFLKNNLKDFTSEKLSQLGPELMSLDSKKDRIKVIAHGWKKLSPEERAIYDEMAREDKLRFVVEQAGLLPTDTAWEDLDSDTQSTLLEEVRNRNKDLVDMISEAMDAKSQPLTGYKVFLSEKGDEIRKELLAATPDKKGKFLAMVSDRWRALTESERAAYGLIASEAATDYVRCVHLLRSGMEALLEEDVVEEGYEERRRGRPRKKKTPPPNTKTEP